MYVEQPAELGLGDDIVLRVMKPIYGILYIGLHRYLNYLEHHLDNLGMIRTRTDPYLLVQRKACNVYGVIELQVDDSLGFGAVDSLKDD